MRGDGGRTGDPADERVDGLWAELEGETEGPLGRGRDQEVISQTERPASVSAAADQGLAAMELVERELTRLGDDPAVLVERLEEGPPALIAIRERSPDGSGRTVAIQVDSIGGSITLDRSDGARTSVDADAIRSGRAAALMRRELSWVRDGAGRGRSSTSEEAGP
jgi:hypothetical protein